MEFVNYEQSLLLKQLGFDKSCFAFWDGYNGNSHLFFELRTRPIWVARLLNFIFGKEYSKINSIGQDYLSYLEGDCVALAPFKQQVLEWFRDQNLFGIINVDQTLEPKFCYSIFKYDAEKGWTTIVFNSDLYYSYSVAESACIDKLIDIKRNEN